VKASLSLPAASVISHVCSPRRGVRPSYTPGKVLKLLLLLLDKEPLGRHTISRELGIGESSARTLVRRLRELGVVDVDPVGGCVLTGSGRRMVAEIRRVIPLILDVSSVLKTLSLDRYAFAARIRVDSDWNVLKVRDSLVREGASAALILRCVGGKLVIPPDNYGEETYPELRDLKKVMGAESGDSIAISFASDRERAEEALMSWLAKLLDP